MERQGKHIPGHNNFILGRSELTHPDPLTTLQARAFKAGNIARGMPGFKERVDFGEGIGNYVNPVTELSTPTTKGIIHYGADGVHIVPARP
jgi:filamentous hemagglutinin